MEDARPGGVGAVGLRIEAAPVVDDEGRVTRQLPREALGLSVEREGEIEDRVLQLVDRIAGKRRRDEAGVDDQRGRFRDEVDVVAERGEMTFDAREDGRFSRARATGKDDAGEIGGRRIGINFVYCPVSACRRCSYLGGRELVVFTEVDSTLPSGPRTLSRMAYV